MIKVVIETSEFHICNWVVGNSDATSKWICGESESKN